MIVVNQEGSGMWGEGVEWREDSWRHGPKDSWPPAFPEVTTTYGNLMEPLSPTCLLSLTFLFFHGLSCRFFVHTKVLGKNRPVFGGNGRFFLGGD